MRYLHVCAVVLALIAAGCSSAPKAPRKDAPRAEWEAVLKEGDSASRELAVRKLAQLDTDFTWDLVEDAAYNEDPFARLAAAEVLQGWEETDEAISLLDVLRSDDFFLVRWQAINSLAVTDSVRAVEPLAKAAREDPNPVLRGEAARALGSLGRQEAIPHLVELLRDGEASVVLSAAESLAALTDEPVVPNYQAWKSYLAGDTEPLRTIAEEHVRIQEENKQLAQKEGRGVLAAIGQGVKRLFTRQPKTRLPEREPAEDESDKRESSL